LNISYKKEMFGVLSGRFFLEIKKAVFLGEL